MENAAKSPAAESTRDVFQRLISENPSGGWEKSWEAGATPWDLGRPTPIIVHLTETDSLPKGRVLVPGCGTGYDVVAMACPDRYVIGLDVSKTAVERSLKMFSSLPNAKYFSFLSEDFFSWEPAEKFDLIFDYTFFCALEPSVRPLWAQRMEKLLKPGGELITLMFPIDERSGFPPYQVPVSEYEKVLIPLGFEVISIVDNELAIGPRKVNIIMNFLVSIKITQWRIAVSGLESEDNVTLKTISGNGEAWKMEKIIHISLHHVNCDECLFIITEAQMLQSLHKFVNFH